MQLVPQLETHDSHKKRTARRLAHSIDVEIVDVPSAISLTAKVTDISEAGMRILCNEYLAPKTRYTFKMLESPHIVASGEVRWVKSSPNGKQCGILFVEMSEEERRCLDDFVTPRVERTLITVMPELLAS